MFSLSLVLCGKKDVKRENKQRTNERSKGKKCGVQESKQKHSHSHLVDGWRRYKTKQTKAHTFCVAMISVVTVTQERTEKMNE